GTLQIKATAVGQDSVLAQIIQMVEQAQGSRLPIQAVVDKVTLWFVPAVMALAALSFMIWFFLWPEPNLTYALLNAVAILLIVFLNAMVMTKTSSILVGTGFIAEGRVLFHMGEPLQVIRLCNPLVLGISGT